MQELTKQTIKRIQAKTQHVVDVEDFDCIEELDRLADKVAGVTKTERRLLNSPFDLCGIKFYPLTVAKSLWYVEKLDEWEIPELYHDGFFFWLLTLPLTDEALSEFSEFKKANKALKKLSKRMHCTTEEIQTICERCCGSYGGTGGEEGEGKGKDVRNEFGGLVASLIREYGQSPEHWLYEAPIEQVGEFYDLFIARIVAEDNANRSTSAKGGKAVAPKATPRLRALKEFRDKAQEIEEEWSAIDGI